MNRSPTDPNRLLDALQLDRKGASLGPRARKGPLLLLGTVLLAAGAAAAVLLNGADPAADGVAAGPAPDPVPQSSAAAMASDRDAPAQVEPRSVLDATGYVVARRQATVSAKTTGKVREILLEEGMQVAEGQVIARLDDSVQRAHVSLARAELEAARSAIVELDAELAHARRRLARSRALAERELVSRAELDDRILAEEAGRARRDRARREVAVAVRHLDLQLRSLQDMEIRAPFAGVVVAKAAQPGEMVSPLSAGGGFTRTGLGTIVDMTSLEVEVDVNEAYINRVHPAQPVTVTLNAYPEHDYPARVLAVIPAADRSRATVGVRVGFRELDRRILPDMGVRVAFLPMQSDEEDGS